MGKLSAAGGRRAESGGAVRFAVNVIWLALGHLVTGFLLCLTIIGVPLGVRIVPGDGI